MLLLENRKARQEYTLLEEFSAGVVLTGGEVKSLRNKSGSFFGSYIKMIGGEAFLLNAQITPYKFADNREYDPKRTRKLLLKKRELENLTAAAEKGLTIIPLSFDLVGRNVKVHLALARGKKQYERREELKRRDIQRDVERELKGKVRMKF